VLSLRASEASHEEHTLLGAWERAASSILNDRCKKRLGRINGGRAEDRRETERKI
jgi:hypothetical protein